MTVLTVSQLNLYAKSLLEGDASLRHLFLRGEISNFAGHYRSGHLYMSLKDEHAAIHAVMFRGNAVRLRFTPCDGMKVIALGRVSIYERDGQYQFYIDDLQPDGLGALYLAYEQLRNRLGQEGLFDPARKKPLPRFPLRVGVVTSKQGAALQDILHILARRWPCAKVVLLPVAVQGTGAARQITEAVRRANRLRAADVLIVGRGGGSLEDLWAFNDEGLARAIAASEIPVVSAVGHETDFTIADFAADVRAPTPSAAAELVSPDRAELLPALAALRARLLRAQQASLSDRRRRLQTLLDSRALRSPMLPVELCRMRLDRAAAGFARASGELLERRRGKLAALCARLDALSPLKTLGRGYAAVFDGAGRPVCTAGELAPGQMLRLRFADGAADAQVQNVRRAEPDKPAGSAAAAGEPDAAGKEGC